MFGGLTKTSSRIAIVAALGLTLGGIAFKATPAKAADLGGDCCADLEERVAELEATTVRKGNKKVSVTLSGWVVKSMNWWDDGSSTAASPSATRTTTLASRFAITGSATIAPGWSRRFQHDRHRAGRPVRHVGNQLRRLRTRSTSSVGTYFGSINTLYSYIYIKSDTLGHPELGSFEPGVGQPGGSRRHFRHRDRIELRVLRGRELLPAAEGRAGGLAGLSGLAWEDFLTLPGPWASGSVRTASAPHSRPFATTRRLGAASGSRPPMATAGRLSVDPVDSILACIVHRQRFQFLGYRGLLHG